MGSARIDVSAALRAATARLTDTARLASDAREAMPPAAARSEASPHATLTSPQNPPPSPKPIGLWGWLTGQKAPQPAAASASEAETVAASSSAVAGNAGFSLNGPPDAWSSSSSPEGAVDPELAAMRAAEAAYDSAAHYVRLDPGVPFASLPRPWRLLHVVVADFTRAFCADPLPQQRKA